MLDTDIGSVDRIDLAFDSIIFSTDFICGAGVNGQRQGVDYYSLIIPSDPDCRSLPGYDYYFCAKLTNGSNDIKEMILEARRPERGGTQPIWQLTRVPLFISEDFHRWYVLDEVQATANHEEFRADIPLLRGQSVYVTNSLPYPSAWMKNWLQNVAQSSEFAISHSLGQTVQGRDIPLLTITDPSVETTDKDRVLVTSGFHPAEPDWLATVTIIESLLGDEKWAAQLKHEFIIDIIPQVNPDGFDLGTNGSNANGINMYWDFRRDDMEASPEAVHLWRWIEKHPPSLYIDYHAYVHQLHKDFRPYIRPLAGYPRPARPAVKAINRAFIELCQGRYWTGGSTNDHRTLAAQMTASFGTITYPKFHMHFNHGVPACRQLGLDVFRVILENARPFRPLHPKTVGVSPANGIANNLLYWWEQGFWPSKARRGWRRLGGLLSLEPSVQESVPLPAEPGLAQHWRKHLWSQRPQVDPVIVIDETGIRQN
jgi:hypothetical protein